MSDALVGRNVGSVRLLTLNRPARRNAINMELTDALIHALLECERDDFVNCVLLTAEGPTFCAGADLDELREVRERSADAERDRKESVFALHRALAGFPKPLVSAVRGKAVGAGAALATAADITILGESSSLVYPEIRHGMLPTVLLPNLLRQIGSRGTFDILASRETLDARAALDLGLASRIVADDKLDSESMAVATALGDRNPETMKELKRLLRVLEQLPLDQAFTKAHSNGDR